MPPMRLKLVSLLFIFSSLLIAQETHNLEIIWVKTASPDVWYFGSALASGDFNHDSFSDIGIRGDSLHGDTWTHKAYIFFGSSLFDTIPDIVIVKGFIRLKGIGDINDDGFDDLALGSPNSPFGRVYIYLGGNPMDTICDFELKGPQDASEFGEDISSGDVNGDSFSDLIVGAYGAAPRPGAFDMGQVYIYYGGPNFDTIPDVILNGGHNGDYEGFGSDIGRCSDVNSDGYEDAVIGAWDYGAAQGRLYVYLGGNPMDSIADVAMIGEGPGQHLGWNAISSLKNIVNFDYAMVGTSLWPRGFPSVGRGKIYVLFGGNPMDSVPDIWMTGRQDSSGLGNTLSYAGHITQNSSEATVAGASREPFDYTGASYIWLGEPNLDTTPVAWIKGTIPDQGIGWCVASAGDVNCDGKDEIMVSNSASNFSPKRVWVCKYTGQGIEESRTLNAIPLMLEVNPNPVKSVVRVRSPLFVKNIKIYDITGKIIRVLDEGKNLDSGEYEVRWDLKDDSRKRVATGIYFIEIKAEKELNEIRKITVVK